MRCWQFQYFYPSMYCVEGAEASERARILQGALCCELSEVRPPTESGMSSGFTNTCTYYVNRLMAVSAVIPASGMELLWESRPLVARWMYKAAQQAEVSLKCLPSTKDVHR